MNRNRKYEDVQPVSATILESLRNGTMSFAEVAKTLKPSLELRAARFIRLFGWSGQRMHSAEDLAQDMLLTLWRAVDSWDPERMSRDGRPVPLLRYVDAQIGRAAQKQLQRAAGYPDPRRSAPARQIAPTTPSTGEPMDMEEVHAAYVAQDPDHIETLVDAALKAQSLVRSLHGLDRQVVELVLEGQSLDDVADRIYADPSKRLKYRMDCQAHARRMVAASARNATNVAVEIDAA